MCIPASPPWKYGNRSLISMFGASNLRSTRFKNKYCGICKVHHLTFEYERPMHHAMSAPICNILDLLGMRTRTAHVDWDK